MRGARKIQRGSNSDGLFFGGGGGGGGGGEFDGKRIQIALKGAIICLSLNGVSLVSL